MLLLSPNPAIVVIHFLYYEDLAAVALNDRGHSLNALPAGQGEEKAISYLQGVHKICNSTNGPLRHRHSSVHLVYRHMLFFHYFPSLISCFVSCMKSRMAITLRNI